MLDSDREILYYLFTEYLKKEKTPQKIINKITRHIHHGDVTQDLNPLLPRDGSRSMNADLTFSTDHAYNIGTDTIGIDKIHFPDVLIHSGADMLLARNSADTAYVDWWMKNVISVNGAVYTDKIRDYTCAKIEINNRVWFSGTGTFWKCQDIDCCDVTRSPIQPDLTTEANFDILNFDDGRDEGVYCLIHLRGGYKFAGVCRMHLGMFVDAVPGAGSQFVEWTIEYKKKSDGDVFEFAAPTSDTLTQEIVSTDTPKQIYETSNFTFNTTGWTDDDVILVYLHRDGGQGNDDYVGDARLFVMHFEFECDELGHDT